MAYLFEDAATFFLDALALTFQDPYHYSGEERELQVLAILFFKAS